MVVANPFAAAAVLDVVLYTADRAPIRNSEWTDLVIPARRSTRLASQHDGQGRAGGRRRARGVGRPRRRRILGRERTDARSGALLGWTEPVDRGDVPADAGVGQTELLLLSTAAGIDPVRRHAY